MGRKKNFSKDMNIEELKMIFGSVALQQALRSIGLSYDAISQRMGVSKRTAWNNNNGIKGCLSWEERENQATLLRIADFIVKCY